MRSFLYKISNILRPYPYIDFLVRKINKDTLVEALMLEEQEFDGKIRHAEQFYENRLQDKDWTDFLSKLHSNSELFFFKYPIEYWMKSQGRQGYVIIENDKIIAAIITRMN